MRHEHDISYQTKRRSSVNKKILILIPACLLAMVMTANAQETSIGLKAGLLGAGVELESSFTDFLSGRIGANYYTYSYDGTEDDINYNFDLNLKSASALLDIHPFKGAFRITGGILYNNNGLDASATSADTFNIGDEEYTGEQVGHLFGTVDFADIAPYFGIGVDTSFGQKNSFGFLFELGAVYQGSPHVSLTADGPISSNQAFQDNLAQEEKNLEDDLDNFKFYPVLSIGLCYRF
jgi:hypothetical protein